MNKNKTKMSNNKIVPWKLLEIGFERIDDDQFQFDGGDGNSISLLLPSEDIVVQNKYCMIPLNITTLTDLEKMIKFLTPKK